MLCQRQSAGRLGGGIVKGDDLREFRMDVDGSRADQLTRGPLLATGDVFILPRSISQFLLDAGERPVLNRRPVIAAPRFRSQPGAITLLHLAELTIEGIRAERVESLLHDGSGDIARSVRGQQAYACLCPINAPLP